MTRFYSLDHLSLEQKLEVIVMLHRKCAEDDIELIQHECDDVYKLVDVRAAFRNIVQAKYLLFCSYLFNQRFKTDQVAHADVIDFLMMGEGENWYMF